MRTADGFLSEIFEGKLWGSQSGGYEQFSRLSCNSV
jgi:hypothetical protein